MTRRYIPVFAIFALLMSPLLRADDWPQWMGPGRDNVWNETGILASFAPNGPAIRWRVPVGAGYSSPSVANGRVFVIDRKIKQGAPKAPNPFARLSIPGVERVLCLSAADGKTIWSQEYSTDYTMSYNAGPRAAPLADGGRVYTFGGEGDLQCRDAGDGKLVWSQHLGGEHTPMWGFASSPIIEGNNVIVLGGDPAGVAIAFDKNSGQRAWQALPAKEPGYSSPIVIEAGGTRQLIIWHAQALNSLDPQTGKVYWSEPFESQAGMSIATPRRAGDYLLISAFYNGAMVMKLDGTKPAATKLWKIGGKNERNTAALHAVMCTPVIQDQMIYGVCSYGQLRGLRLQTGERLWETLAATSGADGPVRWANAFIVSNRDRYFLFNEKGDLIIAHFTPQGYQEVSRAHVIDPTNTDPGRAVVWSQPAFAGRCVFVRNDKELVCASLAEGTR